MRSISSNALAKLATNLGTEPLNIVEIAWVPGAQRTKYADRDLPNIKGRILELSEVDAVISVSGGTDSQKISVTLDDTDGSIKQIMDTADIHKRPCWVYQTFDGLALSDRFLIFKGVISSPVVWNEGDRTIRFDVISQIESAEVGFSIEEGDFVDPPEELIGKPWPLCFGTVINVPALRTRPPFSGIVATGNGIRDFTLPFRINQAREVVCPVAFEGVSCVNIGNYVCTAHYNEEPNCVQQRNDSIADMEFLLAQQASFELPTMRIFGGEKFPQGKSITLNIDGGKFRGSFSGDIFTITSREHPERATTVIPPFQQFAAVFPSNNIAGTIVGEQVLERNNQIVQESQAALDAIPAADFFWARPGAEVTLDGDEEIRYIANIIPSTILRVAAYREFEAGGRVLTTVPSSYYTVEEVDYTGYQVVEIILSRPLSRQGTGWDDNLYVTLTSDVGPNTVDILTWLIETYTQFGIDETSFDAVRDLIDNYPMHFPVLTRPNIIELLADIAYQARCALWLRDDTFFIKYLAEDPTPDDEITESDVEANTLEIFHTETEDLVTKLVAEWKKDYALAEPNKLILRHNVKKYGTHEQTTDFFCFNIQSLVLKAATFWLIRKANTWRKVRFQTALHKLNLETFDTVTLTLPDLAASVKGVIEKASYDSANHTMDFECWTPLKSGTTVPYDFAFPADIEELALFPTVEERNRGFAGSGDGPSFQTRPPTNHPFQLGVQRLAQGFSMACNGEAQGVSTNFDGGASGQCRPDFGNRNPSDRGDAKPTPQASNDNNGFVGKPVSPPFGGRDSPCCADIRRIANNALAHARKAQEDATQALAGSNAKGGGTPEDLPKPDEVKGCRVDAQVFYGAILMVDNDPEKTCGDTPTQSGPQQRETFSFKTVSAAQAYLAQATARRKAQAPPYCVGDRFYTNENLGAAVGGTPENGFCTTQDEGGDTGFDNEGNPQIVAFKTEQT